MNDHELQAWLLHALQNPGLPDILFKLKKRVLELSPVALRVGDTDKEKTEIATLTYVIEMFEHFNEYADTETETVPD